MTKKITIKTASSKPSRAEAEEAVRTLIRWIGENPKRDGLIDTPRRVIKAFDEYFEGYNEDPGLHLKKTFDDIGGYGAPVLVKNIQFESRCEHHMAPFLGVAHIAYIPSGRVVGLSKLARLVDGYARRMQVQERLTVNIADALQKQLKPKGIAVMLEAEHFCMKVRGVHKKDAMTITTQFRGAYAKDDDLREEFFLKIK